MRLQVLFSLSVSISCAAAAQTAAPWTYEGRTGPLNWGKLDPSYRACSQGKEQSPIDIRGARLNKALPPIEFHYIAGAVTVENDGRTIVVHAEPRSYMVAGGVRYDLQELVFHHPSEESVHGKLADMDVELVHRSADGKVAIVAVRLAESLGGPNATLATIWHNMPDKAGDSQKVDDMVNAGGLLPADRGYWTYMGSMTTPPCAEGVHWFVMEQELTISREQATQFVKRFRIDSRELQDPHGRKIEANE
jgi:carbonic anhydrase